MKKDYESPCVEIVEFLSQSHVTTSFTIDEMDDGGFYNDKW